MMLSKWDSKNTVTLSISSIELAKDSKAIPITPPGLVAFIATPGMPEEVK